MTDNGQGRSRVRSLVLATEDIRVIMREVGLDRLMDEIIAGLERALEAFTPENDRIPIREGFSYGVPSDGLLEWMPAMTLGGHATMKIVGYHPSNPNAHQLPTILSTALTFDTGTGQLLGICDATVLTAMRTGAASAVATEIFFRFARELNCGKLIDIEIASDDSKNPYDFIGADTGLRRDTAPRPRSDRNLEVYATSALAQSAE